MSIQRLHKETIYYAKLLQDAYTEKKKMEIFLKQIINQENSNQNEQITNQKNSKKEMNILKKDLEKITKNFNTISSQNQKKRNEISTLRKERTLYDHLFKTLEYQILHQEKDLLEYIQKNDQEQKFIVQMEDKLQSIKDLVKKNTYKEFYKVIEKEKQNYLKEITEPYKQKNLEHRQTLHCLQQKETQNLQKKNISANSLNLENSENQSQIEETILKSQEIKQKQENIQSVEELIAEFKYYTEGFSVDFVAQFVNQGEKINSDLYSEFCTLEQQLGKIKEENNSIQQAIMTLEYPQQNRKTICNIENQNQKTKIYEEDLEIQKSKLNQVLVFQKENLLINTKSFTLKKHNKRKRKPELN